MDATSALNAKLLTNGDFNHLEIFSLVWLDDDAGFNKHHHTEEILRAAINHIRKFHDVEDCKNYIEQTSIQDRLLVIVSDELSEKLIPSIHHFRQVTAIYIHSKHMDSDATWTYKLVKIRGVVENFEELVAHINRDYKLQKKMEEPLSINMFTTVYDAGKSTSGINAQFIFYQVLIDCLLRLKPNENDKTELISRFNEEYAGNHVELSHLHQFQNDYSPDKALWWYTCDSFFYKTLNAALRKQNIHMIFLYRSFIADIHHQLEHYQAKSTTRVYRSQLISREELDYLQNNVGQFISVNSFLSTSNQRRIAEFYAGDPAQYIDLERIIFEIDADPSVVTTKPFGDISMLSSFPEEDEVLFMLGSIFRLNSINLTDNQIWIIGMSLCRDDEHSLQSVLGTMKERNGTGETNMRTLAKVLWSMGKFDLAKEYYIRYVNELSLDDNSLLVSYEDIASIASQQNDYEESLKWHRKLEDLRKRLPTNTTIARKKSLFRSWWHGIRYYLLFDQLTSCQRVFVLSYFILLLIVMAMGILSLATSVRRSYNSKRTRFIPISIPDIPVNANWSQHGVTVAGGHGDGYDSHQLSASQGLFVDDNQAIYIADKYNHRIVRWKINDTYGQLVAGEDGQGSGLGQLNNPTDVLIDKESGSLIICDSKNKRVVQWSHHSNATQGEILIDNIDCWGLAMDDQRNLYVSDFVKHEVRRYEIGNQNGALVAGGNDKDADENGERANLNQLKIPQHIFVDREQTVYVSDWNNHRVMKWYKDATEGIIVAGGNGSGDNLTQLSYPIGLAVDTLGTVYVADYANHRVLRWPQGATQGTVIAGGNGEGSADYQLNGPTGLSFDHQGNLYVIDSWNFRVQRFSIE